MKKLLLTLYVTFFFTITFSQSPKATLYIFLAKDCPICQYYTLNLKKLYDYYQSQGIEFKGIFSVPQASKASIEAFQHTYQLPFPLLLDIDQQLMEKYQASVTPEVVLVNHNDQTIYRGRIDDTYQALGKRKRTAPHQDLANALEAFIQGNEITPARTQPVGCFITPIQK